MPLSSCFDCIYLQDDPNHKNVSFWCPQWEILLTYDKARTVNECPKKEQYGYVELIEFPQYKLLKELYDVCVKLAEYLERPFTIRELSERVGYSNRNSLWVLLDKLVKAGKIEKVDISVEDVDSVFVAKVYFPVDWNTSDISA